MSNVLLSLFDGIKMEWYAIVPLCVSAAALLISFVLYRRMIFLSKRYNEFMSGADAASLEGLLRHTLKEFEQLQEDLTDNRNRLKEIYQVVETTIRGVGVVRFNAFQNTGSDLSFSVAYIDAKANGVVCSGIYGREESRTYAKPVKNGDSSYLLSNEEREAISQALKSIRYFKYDYS